jgi:hypothetical protein
VTVYYNITPADHDLVRIVAEFREPIESTTKNPVRLDPNCKSRRALQAESYDLKGAKLELVIVDGFCSDYEKNQVSKPCSAGQSFKIRNNLFVNLKKT